MLTAGEIEGVLRLRDEMSGVITRALQITNQGFGGAGQSAKGFGGIVQTALGTMGGFVGAQAILGGVQRAFGFLQQSVVGTNNDLESSTLAFGTLMGDAQRAEEHVRSLFQFAKDTPFETGPIIKASRLLQTFGGDALNTMDMLTLVGDAAAATGGNIDDLSFWVGRAYSMIKGGQPFGEAAMRLTEMAVMTPQVRQEMERLQKSGADAETVFKVFTDSLGRFDGAMIKQAKTWGGLMSTFKDSLNMTMADAFAPFFEMAKGGLTTLIELLGDEGVTGTIKMVADALADTLGVAVEYAIDIWGALVDVFRAVVEVFGGDFQQAGTDALATFSAFADLIVSTLVAGLHDFAEWLREDGVWLKELITQVASPVWSAFSSAIKIIGFIIGGWVDLFKLLSPVLMPVLEFIGSSLWAIFRSGLEEMSKAFERFVGWIEKARIMFGGDSLELPKVAKAMKDTGLHTVTAAEGFKLAAEQSKLFTEHNKKALPEITTLTKAQQKEIDEATKAYKKMREAASGTELFEEANRAIRVLKELGGATKLTAEERDKFNKILTDAHEKSVALHGAESQLSRKYADHLTAIKQITFANVDVVKSTIDWNEEILAQIDALNNVDRTIRIGIAGVKTFGFETLHAFQTMGKYDFQDLRDNIDRTLGKKKWEDTWSGIKSGLSGALNGIPQTLMSAFQGGGDIMGAVKSIATQIGSTLGGGIGGFFGGPFGQQIGSAIGSLAGPLVGKISELFSKPAFKDVARRVGRDWGVEIGEELAKSIADQAKSSFGGSRQASEIFNLDKILGEAGGLTEANLPRMTGKLRDTFSMIATHQMTIAQGAETIDKNWRAFVSAGTDGAGRLSASLKEIVQLNDQMGVQSKEIAAWQQEQAMSAIAGFNAVAAVTAGSLQGLEDLGVQAVASYTAAVAAGKTHSEALGAMGGSLQSLFAQYQALGLETENVALKNLMLQATIVQNNPQLIAAIDGLSQQMVALDNIGLMNIETFGAMERTGYQMYLRLQGEVAKTGGSTRDALVPMQKYLHDAMVQADLLGIPLDENLQMLVDQSKELGIWKEAGKSASDKLIDGMSTLVDKVTELLDRIAGVADGINAIPTDFVINVGFNVAEFPSFPMGGPVPGFAGGSGGLRNFGVGTLAVLHGEEGVYTRKQVEAMERQSDVSMSGVEDRLDQLMNVIAAQEERFLLALRSAKAQAI